MFTVMLVDDEPIILEKLDYILTSLNDDCQIVARAGTGEEALRQARLKLPRIIISDIHMPLLNGIELARLLKEELPESLIILISGYNEFSYAQQAIATGVFRYLLKPIDAAELGEILGEAKRYLTLRQQEFLEKERLKTVIKANIPRLQEKFFTDLLAEEYHAVNLKEQLRFLELAPAGDFFGVIALQPDNYPALQATLDPSELHLLKFMLLELIKTGLEGRTRFNFAFIHKPSEMIIIFGVEHIEDQEGIYQELLTIQARFSESFSQTFSAGLGRLYPGLESLKTSYGEARLALDFKVWAGKNAIIPYHDIERSSSGRLIHLQGHDDFIVMLREGNLAKAEQFIDQYFQTLSGNDAIPKSLLNLAVLDLINPIIRTAMEFNTPFAKIFTDQFDPLREIDACETLEDMALLLKGLSEKAIRYIDGYKQEIGKNFVEKARCFLEEHYSDPDLNLNAIAEHVYVSSCYLSHLFKQVAGATVTEYLNKVRIRAAQRLLKQTRLKIYEIAAQVGFNDSHYFSIVFKKLTGISAIEYRDKVMIDNYI
jgi:two-component system response regulator YesN